MARPAKPRLEGEAKQPNPIRVAVEQIKAEHPDKWDALRLCPAQHALDELAALLD